MATTAESVEGIIKQRLFAWDMMVPLLTKHGLDKVQEAIEEASYRFVGLEEVGSSDASYMVDSAVRILGEPSIFKERT